MLGIATTFRHTGNSSDFVCLDDIDRRSFAMGVAQIFCGRWLNRMYDMARGPDPKKSQKAFEDAAQFISAARLFLDPDQWLTFQYELGYSQFDIMAFDEAKTWLKKYIDNLTKSESTNGTLSPHWRVYKKAAEQKLALIPMMEEVRMRNGGAFSF